MNQRKMTFGVQIIALLLLIQAANSFKEWENRTLMFQLQGIVEDTFCGKCRRDNIEVYNRNVKYIAGLKQSGKWNLNENPISENGNNIESMTFQTVKVQGNFEFPNTKMNGVRQVSGLLATPDMPGPLKGIVIYFHGTFFSKNQTPSSQTYPVYKGVASIFGAKKYAVLFPDYLGYGADEDNVHPYVLYPEQNILTATYLLNLVAPILNKKFGNVNEANPLPLMSTGYSEGGAYGVFFGACNSPSYNNRLKYCSKALLSKAYKIVAISGSEGAYDTEGVVSKFLFSEVAVNLISNPFKALTQQVVNMGKPGLSALALYSFATYNPQPFELEKALVKDYYNMVCAKGVENLPLPNPSCLVDGVKMNIKEALSLAGTKGGSGSIVQAILYSALQKSNNGFTYFDHAYGVLIGSKNNVQALIEKKLVIDNPHFKQALSSSTVVDYGKVAPYPVYLFSLQKDSIVSPLNTKNFIDRAAGKVQNYHLDNSEFKVCGLTGVVKVDHVGAYIVSHVFVLNFFEKIVNSIKSTTSEDL